jgi:hypothetical protein
MSEKLTARRASFGQNASVTGMMVSFALKGFEKGIAVAAAITLPRSALRVMRKVVFVMGVISFLAAGAISLQRCELFSYRS